MIRILFFLLLTIPLASPLQATTDDNGVESLRRTGKAFASVAKTVSPSVVNIQIEEGVVKSDTARNPSPFGGQSPFGEDFLRRFFGDRLPAIPRQETPQRKPRALGQGSGFVFAAQDGMPSDKTYILTNNHVVEDAQKIRVRLQDGREFDAKIAGRDPESDVAVIEIPTTGLPALRLADSTHLEVGEWVMAIGNPFGLRHTVTVGVVSAKGRTSLGINDYEDFIQTDAAINPGNSGGPLVNLDGEAVGMNTAIFSRSGGYMGVGFAIPSSLVSAVANQLIASGEVKRGFLGVVIQQLTQDLVESFGLDRHKGILIAQVSEGSPADKAGLRQGDLIIAHEGALVSDIGAFRNRIALTPPGTRTQLTILRDGKEQEVTVTVGTLSKDTLASIGSNQNAQAQALGLSVQTLTKELAEQLGATPGEGVVVTKVEPGSISALAGIEAGTLILQVNRKPVADAMSFKQAIAKSPDKRALLLLRKDGMQRFVALSW